MNRKIIALLGLIFFSGVMYSQEISKNALGLRIGDDDGFGIEISYQRALKKKNRLELDLGLRDSRGVEAIKIVGLHQWVMNIDKGFNWYAGIGGGVASYRFNFRNDFDDDDGRRSRRDFDRETSLFVAGDLGIEYNFDFPLLLSLDFRPEFGFGNFDSDLGFDIALGIRYQFK